MRISKGKSKRKFEVSQIYPGWAAYHSFCYYFSFDINRDKLNDYTNYMCRFNNKFRKSSKLSKDKNL